MRRRNFISLVGGAAAWPIAARGQQRGKLPIIGFMGTTSATAWAPWTAAFVQRLRELGWIEDRTVAIEYRWAEGGTERFSDITAEFVRLNVDIIVTAGIGATTAAKQVTSVIPILFVLSAAPVATGLVASMARPGGNVTGLSTMSSETASKRLELLREVVPALRRLAVMANAGFPDAVEEMREVRTAAKTLGLELIPLEIRRADDITLAFEGLKSRADALYVCADALLLTHRIRINSLAMGARLPTMHNYREYVEAGGLMGYGPNIPGRFRRAADLADKILRGAKPADIPVEQPTQFDLFVNLTTAKVLGLAIPEAFLLRADELVE